MPTWGQILEEILATADQDSGRPPDYDLVRRRHLKRLSDLLAPNRAVIVYASGFLEGRSQTPDLLINLLDVQGMMEAVSNIGHRKLDLILHTPGGLAEGAEQVLRYLRTRFDHIRAVVPLAAMSAGTMLALGCDEIVLGAHSQLGPIDPQFQIITADGPRQAPAEAILAQFERAKKEIQANPGTAGAWLPILSGYGPGLLSQCVDQRELGKELVKGWLVEFMLKDDPAAERKAQEAVDFVADYRSHKTHGRPLRRENLKSLGLKVVDLEADDTYQDAVLSVHHAVMHTLGTFPITKLIENHAGRAFIRWQNVGPAIQLAVGPPPGPAGPPGGGVPPAGSPPSRNQQAPFAQDSKPAAGLPRSQKRRARRS